VSNVSELAVAFVAAGSASRQMHYAGQVRARAKTLENIFAPNVAKR
jgi:hypothetical protein